MKKTTSSGNKYNLRNVTVYLSDEAKQQLIFLCELHNITPSALCRKVIMNFLNRNNVTKRKAVADGKSAVEKVNADDEWLCEAYMKTDYTKLSADDFQRTLNNYLSYLVKEGNVYETNGGA